MRYALLIYVEPWESTPEEDGQVMEAYNAFTKSAVEAGVMRGGEALHEAKTATTVRVRNGQTIITDGPFAETKEEFGGFYLIEASDIDEAIGWAAKIPGAVRGSIEVRPVWEIPDSDLGAGSTRAADEEARAGASAG